MFSRNWPQKSPRVDGNAETKVCHKPTFIRYTVENPREILYFCGLNSFEIRQFDHRTETAPIHRSQNS